MSSRFLKQDALADLADVPATSRWVNTGTLRLHVLDYGGEGVPLVVLPGITSPAVTMDFIARELTDLVRPVVLDIRGRGLSDDGDAYDLESYAEDTEKVITELGLDQPVLLGHSMGARIAAVTAVRGKVALRGSILVDPPMSGPGRDPYPTTLDAFMGQLAQAQRGTDADEVARSWPRWPRREQELRARWLSSCGEEALRATHEGFEAEEFFDWWPSVPMPVTMLYGDSSPVVTSEGVQEATRTHSAARIVPVPDAGHMIFWDNLEPSIAAVREALAPLTGNAPSAASSGSETTSTRADGRV